MSKQLIFDIQIVIDLWLKIGSASITQELLNQAETIDAKIWMPATAISRLEIAARHALQQTGLIDTQITPILSKHMRDWLARIGILTDHGFEQAELYAKASCFQDAQIVAAARSLTNKQPICIVTENLQFDNLGEALCKTSIEALDWLIQTDISNPLTTIPFIDLATQQTAIRQDLEQRLERVLRHGQYILGPEVWELEIALANYTGAKYCIAVSSGTDALIVSLMALGIGVGDEVITTPFTFVATAEAIVLVGARPVFIDIDPQTCNINTALIEASITERTKAIMPVSLYGQPADMDAINAIAAKYKLPVIEDAAQSFGAEYRGRKSCNLSIIGCTSFFPAKPLGCYGDGGAIFTNDESIAQTCRELRVHGQSERYRHNKIGVMARMDSMQCAVVLAKLKRLDWELKQRQIIAKRYSLALNEKNSVLTNVTINPLPWPQSDRTSVFAQYTILTNNREALQTKLHHANIPSAVHYPLSLTEQLAYREFAINAQVPVTMEMTKKVLSLPMGPDLSAADQDRIISCILA